MSSRMTVITLTVFCSTVLPFASSRADWVDRGKVGGGLAMNGDVCIKAEGLGQLDRASLTLWLQPHKLPDSWNAILHTDGWEAGGWHLMLLDNGRLQNSMRSNNPVDVNPEVALPPKDGKWYHLAVVYDAPAKTCVIYVDGKQAATTRYTRAEPLDLDNFCIGAWNDRDRLLHGVFDDIRLYRRTLSPDEIQRIFQGGSFEAKPLLWWMLDEKSDVIADASGNGHHAKLVHVETETTVYKQAPLPEANPWQDKGIRSAYVFGAYYTRKPHDEPWHQASRTDEYDDVMVRFGNGPEQLVLTRRTSYRPVWITQNGEWPLEEIVPRTGDGTAERPDATNRFARARIVESTSRRAVIHWRYLPELPEDIEKPDPTRFVDEYFVVTPDRRIIRAVRPGTLGIDPWRQASNVQIFTLQLANDGVTGVDVTPADRATALETMGFQESKKPNSEAAQIRRQPTDIPAPVATWHFDEGHGATAAESVGNTHSEIAGHAAYWRQGISGHALAFDGWYSTIRLGADKAPRVHKALTLDAWVALAAYPWNYCPVVQHGDVIESGAGWFLGLSAHGKPTLCVSVAGNRHLIEAEQCVERYRWTHLTGVIDAGAGSMKIYIDGIEAASKSIPPSEVDVPEGAPVQIAQGPALETAWPVRFAVRYPYTLDGLIDEVRVFDETLSPKQAQVLHQAFDPGESVRNTPDLEKRVLPAGDPSWNRFAAHYTHLPFHSVWDNLFRMSGHPDIVVTFDKLPVRYVLWHGTGYIPMLVTENGRWYSNEFNETWWRGCCEPMSDKKMMFGRVHIIEQSPARIVLRWRYPLSNIYYGIYGENDSPDGWGEWSEWIFSIYPDGSIVKKMRVYGNKDHTHEWHESMAIMGPDQHPETVVDKNNTLEVVTAGGELRQYNWTTEPPKGVNYRDAIIHKINLFAEYDPYTIQKFTGGDVYSGERTEYAVFPSWDHWPVSQLPSDGRKSRHSDRTSHSSLTHLSWGFSVPFGEQGLFTEKVLLEGLTKQNAKDLLPMARFFLDPPRVEPQGDGFVARYDMNQKAYVLTRRSGDVKTMRFTVHASQEHPLVNPAFVVENWAVSETGEIRIDGRTPGNEIDLRQAVVPRANGVNALVVWIEMTNDRPVTIDLSQ